MSKQIKIGLDKVPAPVTKQFTQLIDIDGTKLFDSAGNPLVTEEETSLSSTNNSLNALSVFTNNTSIGDLSLPVAEQFPVESAVSSSLLGVPRSEEQLSLFSDVATYGLDEDNWSYYIYSGATTPVEWYRKENPIYGRRHNPQFREGSNEQALYLKSFPSQYTFPRGPLEQQQSGPTIPFMKYMNFIALGRYLFDYFKDYDLEFSERNFIDQDMVDIIKQDESLITQGNSTAYHPNFTASPMRFDQTSIWYDVVYKTDTTQPAFDAIERWTSFYDKIRDNTAVFPELLGSETTDYTLTDQYKAIRSFLSTRDYALPGQSSTAENFAILQSEKAFRYQPGRASGFTFGSRMDPGDPNSTANTIEWGCSNDTDEYMFQLKGSQFSIVRRSIIPMPTELLERQGLKATDQSSSKVYPPSIANTNGLWETVIPRTRFNGDSLLGSGNSGYILSFEEVTMYKIEYSWYGAIGAKFYAYIPVGNGEARWVLLHTFIIENGLGQPVLANPDFKFKYLISSNETSGLQKPMCLYKYGSSYYVDGGDEGTMRLATTTVDKKSFTTNTPILGILPKEKIRNSEGIELDNFKKSYPATISVNSSRNCRITIQEVKGSPSGFHFNFSPSVHMNGRHPDTRLLEMSFDVDNPGPEGINKILLKQPPAKTFPNSPAIGVDGAGNITNANFGTFPVSFLTGYDFYDPADPALSVQADQRPYFIPFDDNFEPAIGSTASDLTNSVYQNDDFRVLYSSSDLAKFGVDATGNLTAGYTGSDTGTNPVFDLIQKQNSLLLQIRGVANPRSNFIKVVTGESWIAPGVYRLTNISNSGANPTATIVNIDGTSVSTTPTTNITYDKLLNVAIRAIEIGNAESYVSRDPRILRPQFYAIRTVPGDNLVRAEWFMKKADNSGYGAGEPYNTSDEQAPWRSTDLPPSGFNSTTPKDITTTSTTLSVNTNGTITGATDFQLSAGDLVKVREWDQNNITPGVYKVASDSPTPTSTTFKLVQNDGSDTALVTTANASINYKAFTVSRSAIGQRVVSVGDTIGFYGGGTVFADWNPSYALPDPLDDRLYTVTEIIDDQNFRVDRKFPSDISKLSRTGNDILFGDLYWPQSWAGDALDPLQPSSFQGFGIPIVRAFQKVEDKGKIVSDGVYGKYVNYGFSNDKQSTDLVQRTTSGGNLVAITARDSLKVDGSRIEPDQTISVADDQGVVTSQAPIFSAYISALRTIVGSDVGISSDRFKIHFLVPRGNRDALTNRHFADWSIGVTPYKPTEPDTTANEKALKFLVDATGEGTYKLFDYSDFPMCDYSHRIVRFDHKERAELAEDDRAYIRHFEVDRRFENPVGEDTGYIGAIQGSIATEDHEVLNYAEGTGVYINMLKIVFNSQVSSGPTAEDIKITVDSDGTTKYLSEVGINFGGTGYNFTTTTQIDADTGEKFIYAENVGQALTLKAQFDAIVNAGGTVKIQTKMLTLSDALEGQSLDEDGQPKFTNALFTKTQAIRFSDKVLYPVLALSDYAKVSGIIVEEINPDGTVRSFTPNWKTELDTFNTNLAIKSSGGSGSDKTPGAFNPDVRLASNRYDTQTLNPLRNGTPIYSFFAGANDATQINLENIFSPDRKSITTGLLNSSAVYVTATSIDIGEDGNTLPGEIEMSITIKEQ